MQRKVDHLKGLLETAYEINESISANKSEWLTPDSLAALIFLQLLPEGRQKPSSQTISVREMLEGLEGEP